MNPIIVESTVKRNRAEHPPAVIVEALKLTAEQAKSLYVSDTQEYSNGVKLVQLHYANDKPEAGIERFRGMVFRLDPVTPDIVKVVAKSFPYEDPIISEVLPEGYSEHRFSESRQGFVARVFASEGIVNISSHRKIDCARSKFGASIPMKEMFTQVAERVNLDLESLFTTAEDRKLCHIFFVSHDALRLIPTADKEPELIYLGSLKSQNPAWGDVEDGPVLADMVPATVEKPALEALRPTYYDEATATALFAAGVPLIAWPSALGAKAPTRLVPSQWDRKERLRGNTPNLKLAWYKLLQTGEQDALREVLPASEHHLLAEYEAELHQMLDGKLSNGHFTGPAIPTEGSLIAYLLESAEQGDLEVLGKATVGVVKMLIGYNRNLVGKRDKVKIAAKWLRKQLWNEFTTDKVYTLIAEYKRALNPAAPRE